jgi:hypothetical protein
MSLFWKRAASAALGGLGIALINYGIGGLRVAENILGAGDNVAFFNTIIGAGVLLFVAAICIHGGSLLSERRAARKFFDKLDILIARWLQIACNPPS